MISINYLYHNQSKNKAKKNQKMSASSIVMNCDDLRNIIFSYAFPKIPKMPDCCECNTEFNYKWCNECDYYLDADKTPKLYLTKDYNNNYKYFCNTCRVNSMMDFISYANYKFDWLCGKNIIDLLFHIIQKEKPNCNEKQINTQ